LLKLLPTARAFSKCGLHTVQFRGTIANFSGPDVPNGSHLRAAFRKSLRAVELDFACNTSQVPQSSKYRGNEYCGKAQFNSAQQCYLRGKDSVREHAVQLENLISIRICNRDPGHTGDAVPVRVCCEQFAFRLFLVMVATACSLVLPPFLTVFKLFIAFTSFFTSKTRLSDAPKQALKCQQQLNHVAEQRHLKVFGCHHRQCSFWGRLFT
jgi:hypothetical protein